MKAALVAACVTVIGVVLVVAIIGSCVVQNRRTGAQLCAAMLGAAPQDDATVESLSGPAAAALAAGRQLTGEDAYRFVVTLNTITNWRQLPADQILDWITDPSPARLPAAAQLDSPWPTSKFDTDQAGTQPARWSSYGQACAMVLHRADARTSTPTSTPAQPTSVTAAAPPTVATTAAPDGAQPDRTAVVAAVTGRLGAVTPEPALWEVICPTPQLDAKRTLFEQLARTSPVLSAAPGDLACYDFTTSGPARCPLVIAAAPTPAIATLNTDGILVAEPIPANSTIIKPVTVNGAAG
jgi:hypothetical protein